MKAPTNYERIVGGKRYSTATASLIADDAYWDGSNHERNGRNRFLYRTKNGSYFVATLTQWEGEQDTLEPISRDEAIALYEGPLTEHAEEYGEAFPGATVEEA